MLPPIVPLENGDMLANLKTLINGLVIDILNISLRAKNLENLRSLPHDEKNQRFYIMFNSERERILFSPDR